jgi:hypothetical protein
MTSNVRKDWNGIGRWVRLAIGVVLVVSAVLKFHDLYYGDATALLWLPSPRWVLAAIEIEMLVGLWLVSGMAARGAWFVSLLLFAGMAGVSFYLGVTGQSSCGCFGRVEVHPWATFAFDIAALALMWLFRPSQMEAAWFPRFRQATSVLALAALMIGIAGGILLVLRIPPMKLIAELRGEILVIDPFIADVGRGLRGEAREVTVTLNNHGTDTIRVVGGTSTCACVTTADLPIQLQPGEDKCIVIRLRFTGSKGRFQQRYRLVYERNNNLFYVNARFSGSVSEDATIPVVATTGRN